MSFDDLGTPLSEVTFVVVDLETTGGRPGAEEITEIGAVKSRGGEIIGEFATLVNPNQPIPPSITVLTGITTAMVMDAPRIGRVLPAFLEFLGGNDTVLVAHNARFDVGHLKAAAAAMDIPFPSLKVVDTVPLARRFISRDETPNYKLGTLAKAIGTQVTPTHRALDDAKATEELLQFILGRVGALGVSHLDDLSTLTDPVPAKRRRRASLANGLPRSPGVYHFIGPAGEVLYVGTSVNVYTRVRQYFTAAEKRKRIADMVDLASSVRATAYPTEFEARINELRDIARFDPPYNRRSKRPERRPWLALTDEPHPRLTVTTKVDATRALRSLGPFTSTKQALQAKTLLERRTSLRTCTRKLPLSPKADARACPALDLGTCDGPCLTGARQEAISDIEDQLRGHISTTVEKTLSHLALLSEREEFERAANERDMMNALVSGATMAEKIRTMTALPQVICARPVDGSYQVLLVHWGRLVASGVPPGPQVRSLAESLAAMHPVPPEPVSACQYASPEETSLIYDWVTHPSTRFLDTPLTPISMSIDSAWRYRL